MVRKKSKRKVRMTFDYLDYPKPEGKEPLAEAISMMIELWRFHKDVDHGVSVVQSISIASTSSVIGIGWAGVYFGFSNDDWATAAVGVGTAFFALAYLAWVIPNVISRLRKRLEEAGWAKFNKKWGLAATVSPAPEVFMEKPAG